VDKRYVRKARGRIDLPRIRAGYIGRNDYYLSAEGFSDACPDRTSAAGFAILQGCAEAVTCVCRRPAARRPAAICDILAPLDNK
jgi:hypothetical protein